MDIAKDEAIHFEGPLIQALRFVELSLLPMRERKKRKRRRKRGRRRRRRKRRRRRSNL